MSERGSGELVVQTPEERQFTGQIIDLAKNTEDETVKLIVAMIGSPVVSMVLATALIEYLQGVEVYKGKSGWVLQEGAHGYWFNPRIKEPLISQGLATTLESVILSSETIKNLGGLGSIAGVLKGLF